MRRILVLLTIFTATLTLLYPSFAQRDIYEKDIGAITGQIFLKDGGPINGGTVFFFNKHTGPPPSHTKYWRVPSHAFRIGKNGEFNATLPVGEYYMGAIKKLTEEPLGPPVKGDIFYMSRDEKGASKIHEVKKGVTLDLGIMPKAELFEGESYEVQGITSIQGTIRDSKGNPAEGMVVFAFSSPVMMGRPLFISDRTGKDGKYTLRLYEGGKYYLRARVTYGGGPPATDHSIGIYRNGKPLIIKTGDSMEGIDITVGKIGIPESGS